MRERDRGREKGVCKGEEEIVGDATILMLFDKITHVSFPAAAESPCLFLAFKSSKDLSQTSYIIFAAFIRTIRDKYSVIS